MRRSVLPGILVAISVIVAAKAQPDSQTVLWMQIKKQLSGPEGERYFRGNLKGTAMPLLKGTLVSALTNEGVSRLVLKMPGSEEPDVTLIVYNGPVKLAPNPARGRTIGFYGVGEAFSTKPFMVTFEVNIGNLQGLELADPGPKNRPPDK